LRVHGSGSVVVEIDAIHLVFRAAQR
jgi:hypothetical protein